MENLIDAYIAKKKNTAPSPFLTERILQSLEGVEERKATPLTGSVLLQSLLVAASVALVIVMGVAIGNRYPTHTPEETLLLINDSSIEQLHFYQNLPG